MHLPVVCMLLQLLPEPVVHTVEVKTVGWLGSWSDEPSYGTVSCAISPGALSCHFWISDSKQKLRYFVVDI